MKQDLFDLTGQLGGVIGATGVLGGALAEGMASLPMSTLGRLNTRMLRFAVKRYTVRRSALLFTLVAEGVTKNLPKS